MDQIRYATPEEIKTIEPYSDISSSAAVVTFGGKDFAVIRNCNELDPVIFGEETTDKRKLLFLMNLETSLRLQGVREIYFNIRADDETWMNVAKNWGAEATSPQPEIRFKKALV
jgi:hypothetical protein